MDMLNLYITYRPLRIGWCVRSNNIDDLRKAIFLSNILWGGRFNPVVPVDNEALALQLVNVFRIDALYPIRDDPEINDFVGKLQYRQWPIIHRSIVVGDSRYLQHPPFVTVLDIYHALVGLHEEYVKDLTQPKLSACLYSWEETDPLNDVFLATFGAYPPITDVPIDYSGMMKKALAAQEVTITRDSAVPPETLQKMYPSKITEYLLKKSAHSGWPWGCPGLYMGDSHDYEDLVAYWNLRAASIDLLFYDPSQKARLDPLKNAWLGRLTEWISKSSGRRFPENRIAIWSKDRNSLIPSDILSQNRMRCTADEHIWNALNITPQIVHFKEHSVLASVTDDYPPRAIFQLPEKPFLDDPQLMHQHLVVSVHALVDISSELATFSPPFIPELNEHYGRKFYYSYNQARAEPSGVGIITSTTTNNLTLRALDVQELIQKIFSTSGIEAKPSQAGRVTSRLIQQMGGLQGCRVFKIAGVRRLIEKYKPNQSFTKSAAIQIIGQNDPTTGHPNYARYESLCLEYNPRLRKWKPEHAFLYLLKKRVFMVGLEFRCPQCELEFWRVLDDVGSEAKCEYCGTQFEVATQLKDHDWAYRRSGLFGREDNQEGGLAVSVVLQQIDTAFTRDMLFTTGMELSAVSPQINCETDLVIVHPEREGRIGLVISECKTRGKIEAADVQNLTRVVDALPRNRFDVFLMFAKLAPFSAEEIATCKMAQGDGEPRVIMLSERELEPYFMYELAEHEFVMRRSHALSLEDMAEATIEVYFNPVLKTGN